VDAIVDARDQLRERAGKLPSGDRLRPQIERLADAMEKQRISLVSSKQGEGISGEEKLREELGSLYGNVNGYEGRPTASQVSRMGVLGKQLEAAITSFDGTLAKGLADITPQLAKRKLAPVVKLTAEAWEQRQAKK